MFGRMAQRVLSQRAAWPLVAALVLVFSAGAGPAHSARGIASFAAAAGDVSAASPRANGLASWPVFDGDGQRSGINSAETAITASTVSQLQQLWQVSLPATADSSPVYLANVATSHGVKNLVFLTTHAGSLVAYDADNGGSPIWQQDTTGPSSTTNSSPAIDPSGQFVYSYGLDGRVHKYAAGSGAETIDPNWPLTATLIPDVEKGSSALNLAGGYLYVTLSGYNGDAGHYVGHVVARNLATNATSVFNALCSNLHELLTDDSTQQNYCPDRQAGVWARAGTVVDPVTGNVFMVTGNGPYTANTAGGTDYGDSIVELKPDLSQIVDSYTPSSFQNLDDFDLDLGSTAPLLLPPQAGSTTPSMAVQGGKDNTLRLVNRQNLSGQGGPNHVGGELQAVSGICGEIKSQPVAWIDSSGQTWVFVTDDCDNLYAYTVTTTAGVSGLQFVYQQAGIGHTSPLLVNGLLFVEQGTQIHAVRASDGTVLWSGAMGGLHWESPLVANGKVYVPDDSGNLTVFGLPPSGTVSVTGTAPNSGAALGGTAITISGFNFASGASVSLGGVAATGVGVGSDGKTITATTPPHTPVGDLNADANVDSVDALCVLREVAQLPGTAACPVSGRTTAVNVVVTNPDGGSGTLPGDYTYNNGDVNGDGSVTALDALCILRHVAALTATSGCPSFPVGRAAEIGSVVMDAPKAVRTSGADR